jgi:hypothetical protein
VVEALEVAEIAERPRPAVGEGVEEAHLDQVVAVKRGEGLVDAGRPAVVEEQAHPHPAPGGVP